MAGVQYEPMDYRKVLQKLSGFSCRHIVITGGEPLLHQRLLVPLLAELKRDEWYVEVETNGTLEPTEEIVGLVDCFNVSPKTSNSTVDARLRTRPSTLAAFIRSGKAWFKFVVADQKDLDEVEELITAFKLPRGQVILMPEGTDAGTLLSRSRWLAEVCKEKGLRFTMRLHILLFGNRRGT